MPGCHTMLGTADVLLIIHLILIELSHHEKSASAHEHCIPLLEYAQGGRRAAAMKGILSSQSSPSRLRFRCIDNGKLVLLHWLQLLQCPNLAS